MVQIVCSFAMRRFALSLLAVPVCLFSQDFSADAPFLPTPIPIVERMLRLGGLKAGEKMFDLGSGDGRIVIMAAHKFKADAAGVELDSHLCDLSQKEIHRKGLGKSARIVCGDLFTQDYSSADLLTIYLFPGANDKLQPILERQLRKGTRIVAHDFEFQGWIPQKTELVENDGTGKSHALYLYVR
jgi:protein-L-isoaspartate O-methyltransferase